MTQQYASKQPQGFKNHIENVAIVGAGGQVGAFIVEALLKTGKHNVTAITRQGGTSKIPTGVTAAYVNYDDEGSLVSALKGQDALIITMGVFAPPDTSAKLIRAAAAANVPWILPNEFGSDSNDDAVNADALVGIAKKKDRILIEELGKSSWVGICSGFWYEFSLAGGEYRYGLDFKAKSMVFFDQGETKLNTTTWPQSGRAVAKLLSLPVLPVDEGDMGTTLSLWRDKFAYFTSFTITQKEMFDSVLRVTGTKESEWKISYEPAKERFENAREALKKGDRTAFGRLLYTRMFFPDKAGHFEATKGLDNAKLDLPQEDLDEWTRVSVKMAEDGYFDDKY